MFITLNLVILLLEIDPKELIRKCRQRYMYKVFIVVLLTLGTN